MKILYKKHKKVADRKNKKPKTLRILTTAFDDGFPHSKLARLGYNPFLKRWHIHWRCNSQRIFLISWVLYLILFLNITK